QYDEVFIVGHSSGCAIARAIDAALLAALGKTSKVRVNLVALDGFAPFPSQRDLPGTQMWSAENGTNKSRNYKSMMAKAGRRHFRVSKADNCPNKWSLNFSLVNPATTDDTVGGYKDISNGYTNCRANLCWVPVYALHWRPPGYCEPP